MTALTPLDPWIAAKIGSPGAVLSASALETYQIHKVRETLALIRDNSPFYRRHLAQAPRDIDSLADLEQFPLTTAGDIRQNPHDFLCVSQRDIHRVVTLNTSGTTGPPKRIFLTADDQELTIDFFHIGMSTFVSPGEHVLILLPGERPGSVGDLLAVGLGRLGAVGLKHGPVRDVPEVLERLRQETIDCIVGVPTHVLALAQEFPSFRLKSVLLSTDHVPDAIRRTLEQTWGCAVYNHYGITEMGLGGGVDCRARHGCHLREADLYFEIIDPQTLQRVPDGQEGEVVFTTLTRRGMPLLRYRTGDISRFIPGRCACGTMLRSLDHVRIRQDGIIGVGGGLSLTMADLDEALFSVAGVSNFTAALEGHHLLIRVDVAQDIPLAILQQALDTIPAIRSGRLTPSVTAQRGHNLLYEQHMKKRTITRAADHPSPIVPGSQ